MTQSDTAPNPNPPATDINARKPGKTTYYTGSLATKLLYASIVVDGLIKDPRIYNLMLPFGYTKEKIAQFEQVYKDVSRLCAIHQAEYAEKSAVYDRFETALTKARTDLSCLVKVAKVALKGEPEMCKALNLKGDKGKTTGDTLNYMDLFYKNLFEDRQILPLLAVYGYNTERAAACRDSYQQARDLYALYTRENADAVKATRLRDEKLAELNEWMYDYYALAKVANVQEQSEYTTEPLPQTV